jgi:hypothetical protein
MGIVEKQYSGIELVEAALDRVMAPAPQGRAAGRFRVMDGDRG